MAKQMDLSAANLKQALWETLQGVRSKKVDPRQANAVASQSREIMRVVRAEIQIAQLPGSRLSGFTSAQATAKRKQLK